jgi:hypothetical protein
MLLGAYALGFLPAAAHSENLPNDARSATAGAVASSTEDFLSSLGVVTFLDQGANADSYIAPLGYTGIRNIREGVRNTAGAIMLHKRVGVRIDLVGVNVNDLISAAKVLAAEDALLAIEGPNEPNNFTITHNEKVGGGTGTWVPVAELQRDLYKAVKSDPILKRYPVFHVSEAGAEIDNVGLQFLKIPKGAGTLFPDGTEYADYANPHNYVTGIGIQYVDNQAWQAADPTLHTHWDGLYVEYGKTWKMGFQGYSDAQLETLPRITSETGWDSVSNAGGEKVQGTILVNVYLAQFKRGWRYTFLYNLRDGEGGAGNMGLFNSNSTPKLSAIYIHNLTTILAGGQQPARPGKLNYRINGASPTVHDMLLQKSDGVYDLVIWGEQVIGQNNVTVDFGTARKSVKIFDVTSGTSPVWDLANVSSIPLVVSDHAMILEIR